MNKYVIVSLFRHISKPRSSLYERSLFCSHIVNFVPNRRIKNFVLKALIQNFAMPSKRSPKKVEKSPVIVRLID